MSLYLRHFLLAFMENLVFFCQLGPNRNEFCRGLLGHTSLIGTTIAPPCQTRREIQLARKWGTSVAARNIDGELTEKANINPKKTGAVRSNPPTKYKRFFFFDLVFWYLVRKLPGRWIKKYNQLAKQQIRMGGTSRLLRREYPRQVRHARRPGR